MVGDNTASQENVAEEIYCGTLEMFWISDLQRVLYEFMSPREESQVVDKNYLC